MKFVKFKKLEFKFESSLLQVKKKNENDWYSKIDNCMMRRDNVLRIEVEGRKSNKSFDLHAKYFQSLNLWLNSIPDSCRNKDSLNRLREIVSEYKDEDKCYVYILCKGDTMDLTYRGPIYIGYSNDPQSMSYYWGSSIAFKPTFGDKKFIIMEKLFRKNAIELENYLIKDLREKGYRVLNQTNPGISNLDEEFLYRIYKEKYLGYEYYRNDCIIETKEQLTWFKSDFINYEKGYLRWEWIRRIEACTGITIRDKEQIIELINQTINAVFRETLNEDIISIDISSRASRAHEMGKILWSYHPSDQSANLLLILSECFIDDSISGYSFVKLSIIDHEKEVATAYIEHLNGEVEEVEEDYFLPVSDAELIKNGLEKIATYVNEYEDVEEIRSQTDTVVNSEEEIVSLLKNSIDKIMSNFKIQSSPTFHKLESGTTLFTLSVVISDVFIDPTPSGESVVKLTILNNDEEMFSRNITYINGEYEKVGFKNYVMITKNWLDTSELEPFLEDLRF